MTAPTVTRRGSESDFAPVAFGTGTTAVGFWARRIPASLAKQTVPGLRTGVEIQRSGRQGVVPFRIDDLSGGYLAHSGVFSWEREKNRYWFNEGLISWIAGHLYLPYKLTSQATLQTVDASGYRAANKRVHSCMFEGDWYGFLDTQVIRSASNTDPSLELPTTDNVTEKVTACAVGDIAGVQSMVYAGGATDNIAYTQQGDGATITWTEFVTLTNTPYVNWIFYFKKWGVWIFSGRPTTALGSALWAFAQNATLPITAPTPVVYKDSKDVLGTIATVTSAAVDLSLMGVDNSSASAASGFLTASGGSVTNASNMAAGVTTGKGIFGAGAWAGIVPVANKITGIQLTVAHVESNADDDVIPYSIVVKVAGSTSANLADGVELGTAGTQTYGGSTSVYGLNITGADLPTLLVEINYYVLSTGVSGNVTLSDVDVTITSRPPGVAHAPTLGGFGAVNPSEPDVVYEISPVSDDLTAVTVQRVFKKHTFSFDAARNEPVVEITYPPIGSDLNYCGVMCDFQGGMAVAGGSNSTLWNVVKLVEPSGRVTNLGFPQTHGATALTITKMVSRGNFLRVDTAYTDGSDAQPFYYYNGAWYAGGVQQDKSSAISTEPILWAETTLNTQQNYDYRFYPVSTTSLAGAYEFVPSDLLADPHLANTGVAKQDGPLYIQLNEMAIGVEEANNAFAAIQMQSRKIDDNTAFGSAVVIVNTTGSRTFASQAWTNAVGTFDAASETYTNRNIVLSGDPGAAYRTGIIRIILDHESGSTETPDGLPILFLLHHEWPHLKQWAFELDLNQPQDVLYIGERLKSLSDTKVVQVLNGGGVLEPAVFKGYEVTYRGGLGASPPNSSMIERAIAIFAEAEGGLSA